MRLRGLQPLWPLQTLLFTAPQPLWPLRTLLFTAPQPLWCHWTLKITAQACSEPQKRSESLLKPAQSHESASKLLLKPLWPLQTRLKSLLKPARSHKSASKPLLKPASRLQWRSKSLVENHCSKSLFEDADLCDTLLGSPLLCSALLRAWICPGSH